MVSGAAVAIALAGCSGSEPKSAPPPPVQPVMVIPPQPRPPLGAPSAMTVPPLNAFGVRQTINANVTPGQLVWNFRSAYNVAALDCMRQGDTAILDNYKAFLKTNLKGLTAANKNVDKVFNVAAGRANVHARETYMTQVYNFYAFPPTLPQFCDAALAMSIESRTVTPKNLDAFAAASLPRLDRIFLDFFTSYDQYRVDLTGWQAKYAPGQTTPVAVLSVPTPAQRP
jgi:hypothetical protein